MPRATGTPRSQPSDTTIVSARKGRRRPTRDEGPATTVEGIVEAAYDIARADGLQAIQIRRVASQLGVWPQAIYYYVPSKRELLRMVADRALATREPSSLPASAPWSERMLDHFRRVTDVYTAHPGLAELVITTPDLAWSEQATAIAEEALSLLVELGLTATEAVRASAALSALILGEAQLQGVFPPWNAAALSTPVDAARFPTVARTLAEGPLRMAEWPTGIEIFVAGMQQLRRDRDRH